MIKKRNIFLNIEKIYLDFLKKQGSEGQPFLNKLKQLNKIYIPICEIIYKKFLLKKKEPLMIGLSGAQGTGKTTISSILSILLIKKYKLNVINFSIDDYYKTLKERKKMSKNINKLFVTRGVPGTHDMNLLSNHLKKFNKKNFKQFSIPKFDKSIDNRVPRSGWKKIKKKPNIIIFEGWCVGAIAQNKKTLMKPINPLEKIEDNNMKWRQRTNYELKKNYKKVFKKIDMLIFLKIPNFKYVFKWRFLQERKLQKKTSGKKIMNKKSLKRFIMFYERITKSMLKNQLKISDIKLDLDSKHRIKSFKIN